MRFRKKDYLIFYVIIVTIFVMGLSNVNVGSVLAIVIGAILPSLILGTITNFLFKSFGNMSRP